MIKPLITACAIIIASSEIYAQVATIRGARAVGCGNSTINAAITEDGQTLSLIFDNFAIDIGTGSANPTRPSVQKICKLLIDVDVPSDVQYAITGTEYRGFAALPASAYGYHRFSQNLPNSTMPVSLREVQLKGPIADNYSAVINQKPGREVYSACNKPQQTIELTAELFLSYLKGTKDRSLAQINLDTVDTGVQSRFKLMWRKCK